MAMIYILLPAIWVSLFFSIQSKTLISPIDQSSISQLEQAKLKISRLELIVEERIKDLNAKSSSINQKEKIIEDINHEINSLETALSSFKDDASRADERLNALENEVRRLWDVSRRNNFEIHNLELKAQDAEERLGAATTRVENMAAIVSEQWIQIQHLEQAVQMAEVRMLKVKRQLSSTKCPFLKYIKNLMGHHLDTLKGILHPYLSDEGSASNSYLSQALHQLMRAFSAAKYYHHQLQGVIKQAMEQHDCTAVLGNKEIVFFVASALIVFPILSACMLLSSHLS